MERERMLILANGGTPPDALRQRFFNSSAIASSGSREEHVVERVPPEARNCYLSPAVRKVPSLFRDRTSALKLARSPTCLAIHANDRKR